MIALDPRREGGFEYVLRSDRDADPEDQTVWTLRPLTEAEWAEVLDRCVYGNVLSDEPAQVSIASTSLHVLKRGIVGVKNLKDAQGNDLCAQQDGDDALDLKSDAFISRIPWTFRIELANAIEGRTRMDDADVEKQEPSPTD